jgi:hypothetical protein
MPRRRVALLASGCVVLAALCRFALFDLVEFKYDEAQVSSYALDLVRHHLIPQTSILTSGGFHNPALMVYLVAIPMLVSTSPLVVTAFFTALNALASGGIFLAGRRLFGDVAALAAAILYAVGPLAVHYSRKIWAPDAMPPFTVLLFAGLALGLAEGQSWWLAAALVALAVLMQLHQAAIALLPATFLLCAGFAWRLPWRRRATWGGLLAGLAGFVVLLLPYANYELQHRFADLRGIVSQVSAHPTLTFVPWRDLWWLTAGWNPQLFFSDLAAQQRPPLTGSTPLDWAMLALGLVGVGVCLFRLVRTDATWLSAKPPCPSAGRVAAATLLLLTLLPPLVIMRSAAPVYPHYFVFLLPLLFLLVGIGISASVQLLQRLRLPAWAPPLSAGAITAILALGSLVRLAGFDQRLTQHTTGGDYGTPLRYSLQAAQKLGENGVTDPAHRSFVMAMDGDTLAVYGYLVAARIAPAAALVQPEQALLLPAAGGSDYLFTGTTTTAYQALRADGAAILPLPRSAPAYTILRLTAGQSQLGAGQLLPAAQPVGPFQVGPGLLLTGAQTSFGGQTGPLNVALAWTVADPTPFARQPVKMFIHLYDAARHTVVQEDALGAAGSTWHRGDYLLTWFTAKPAAPLPPGRYSLVAGVYIVDGLHVFPVRGPNGEALGGEIPLGAVTVTE